MYFIKDKIQMKKLTIIALVAAFSFVSCKDSNKESNASTTDTSTPVATPQSQNEHDHDHAGHNHGANEVAQGMNPPHGEPGHRCDIPVGAPLNSEPTQPGGNTAPASSSGQGFLGSGDAQTTPSQTTGGQSQFTTAPGMQGKPNPAHGQPGHRCDIQVGDPLP